MEFIGYAWTTTLHMDLTYVPLKIRIDDSIVGYMGNTWLTLSQSGVSEGAVRPRSITTIE